MSDGGKSKIFPHVAPHWAAVGVAVLVAIVSLGVAAASTIRSQDVSSTNAKIDTLQTAIAANAASIASENVQIQRLSVQEATVAQKESDLLDLLNRYIAKAGAP